MYATTYLFVYKFHRLLFTLYYDYYFVCYLFIVIFVPCFLLLWATLPNYMHFVLFMRARAWAMETVSVSVVVTSRVTPPSRCVAAAAYTLPLTDNHHLYNFVIN